VVHNKPSTVAGGRTKPCDLQANLTHLSRGCEIISSISARGARVVYTIVYPKRNGRQLRQTFTDTADRRGHSLHIFNVPYLPPPGSTRGAAATVARVTVAVTLARPARTALAPFSFRFVVVR
jgi:hypothetical protein